MLPMHRTIIADTSCFIIFSKIDELELLHKVYGQITTTVDIAMEYGGIASGMGRNSGSER